MRDGATAEGGRRFDWIYANHYEKVLRYCLRRAGREDALDAAAETFAVAWRRRTSLPNGHELPWLYGVARRVLANQRRANRRQDSLHGRVRRGRQSPVDEPETEVLSREEDEEILRALARLGSSDREILRLAGWEELDRNQISLVLDCSPNAVTKRLNRALDHLAAEVGVTQRGGGGFFNMRRVAR